MFEKNKTYSFKPIEQHVESMNDVVYFRSLSISEVRELGTKSVDDGFDIACWTLHKAIVDEQGKAIFDNEKECQDYFANFPINVTKELVDKANEASGLVEKKA